MAQFSNAEILAAVVSEWIRPALAQIASGKVGNIQFFRSVQDALVGMNIVGPSYNIANDIQPMALPVINAMITPFLYRMFGQLDDAAIPEMARSVVRKMAERETYSIMDGLVVFERSDITELANLIEKNLPLPDGEKYQVIK